MEPQIRELVQRAEAGIEGLIRKDKNVRAKVSRAGPPAHTPLQSLDWFGSLTEGCRA